MPLHDYFCTDCEKVYEVLVPLKDTDKKVPCPKCEKPLKKRIAPVRIKLYGG